MIGKIILGQTNDAAYTIFKPSNFGNKIYNRFTFKSCFVYFDYDFPMTWITWTPLAEIDAR